MPGYPTSCSFLRVNGVWYAAVAGNAVKVPGGGYIVPYEPSGPPPGVRGAATNKETPVSTTASDLLTSIESLAKSSIDSDSATSMIGLLARGAMALDTSIKASFPADLQATFTSVRTAYQNFAAAEAALKTAFENAKVLIADIKG